ncbi:MAG: sulfatase activating formylglycine-generating enzyme [Bacteroidia bacterium]|jgi:formylglycine-generating enzyme required for sulfatase activity
MKKLGYFLLLLPLLFAFGKNKKPETSKYLTRHYVKVPAGKVYMHPYRIKIEKLDSLKMLEARSAALPPQRFFDHGLDSCSEFYIASTEITNNNWKEFLYYLKQEGRMEEYNANVLDTTVWRTTLRYNEPYVDYYYQHPAYKEYPAVGMTLKQAIAYADWLTEIFAMRDQGVKVTFSVPTKKQWIRAARGGLTRGYPWEGLYIRNSKGAYLSNHKAVGSENVHLDRSTNNLVVVSSGTKGAENTIIAPAESYYPNQFGIYNMSGNVAELVSDDTVAMGGSWNDTGYDVRVESEQPASEPKSTIGFRVVAVIE